MTIKQNIVTILKNINQVALNPVNVLVVSKNQSISNIEEAIKAGMNNFAENYVQEAKTKWLFLKEKYPHVKLHLIGHLQSNKVQQSLQLFDTIQTLDSVKLVEVIAKKLECYQGKSFFIQVNLDKHKVSGIQPEHLNNLIIKCQELQIPVVGLMGILPNNSSDSERYFKSLAILNKQYNLPELSMGMSGDYLQAIACGASIVRLGRVIFK